MGYKYIKNDSTNCFEGVAFDGENYYFTSNNLVYKMSRNMEILSKKTTTRRYNQLCFDDVDRCFYAISNGSPHKIFKLDMNLNEVDFILIQHYIISVCFFKNSIFYTTADSIFEINKFREINLVHKFNFKMPISIFLSDDGYFVCNVLEDKYLIEKFDAYGKLVMQKNLAKGYTPMQILDKKQILMSKSGIYSYLLEDF